ncbi:hypothetical protein C7212DRAFT_345377 [Tuber magnatum]|uniref:Uncharacterized protein n=1 Tax=Tuber magnatum TaxID=42249 RepID=A0A317SLQ8_9PEZI|nr:hypothetical protein C7212DRAFT_345377 [Tuber magnatum]
MSSSEVYREDAQAIIPSPVAAPNVPVNTNYYLTEGLAGVERMRYQGPFAFTTMIDEHALQASMGNAGHYIVYGPVTEQQFIFIDRIRDDSHPGLRFMYLKDKQTLVIKVKIPGQDTVNSMFEGMIMVKILEGSLHRKLHPIGSTTMIAPSGLKEPDSSFAPVSRPYQDSWPTLVIETALSHSQTRLVADTRWWLENADGQVKIVIAISVSRAEMRIHIEKWENVHMRNQRATLVHPNGPTPTPTKTQEIDIVGNVVTGAPLKLEFEKLMLRQPGDEEGDMIFDIQDLQDFAADFWRYMQ